MMMYANTKSHHAGCCGTSAVAGTSVGISEALGTAVLAVSILIVRLIGLLIFKI